MMFPHSLSYDKVKEKKKVRKKEEKKMRSIKENKRRQVNDTKIIRYKNTGRQGDIRIK